MASTNFTYTPTTGQGTTYVDVSALSDNPGREDKTATITFTNGVASTDVSVRQLFKPYLTQGPTSIPATGGSIIVYVFSEYDICFRSIPLWITVSSGNTTYSEGQRIYASTFGTLPAAFTLTAAANTGEERTIQYSGMNMAHYKGNTLITAGTQTIVGYQEAASQSTPEITVSPDTIPLEYPGNNTNSFTIHTTGVSQVNISNANPQTFTVSPLTGTDGTVVTVTTIAANTGTTDKTGMFTVSDAAGQASSRNVFAFQRFQPYLTQGPTSIPATGGSILVYVYSRNDIAFRNIPLWITVSSGNTTYTQGQRIPASSFGTLPATFTLTAQPNTGSERTIQYAGMDMVHYLGDTLITAGAESVVGYQAAYEPPAAPYINTSYASLEFRPEAPQSKTFTIDTNIPVVNIRSNSNYFSVLPATGTSGTVVTATTTQTNPGVIPYTGVITVSDPEEGASSATVMLSQAGAAAYDEVEIPFELVNISLFQNAIIEFELTIISANGHREYTHGTYTATTSPETIDENVILAHVAKTGATNLTINFQIVDISVAAPVTCVMIYNNGAVETSGELDPPETLTMQADHVANAKLQVYLEQQ